MTKAIIEKEIFINPVSNENISGYLTIKSSETITLNRIMAVVFLEAKGRMTDYRDSLLSFEMTNKKTLTKNESYKIPFTFNSSNFEINSYEGINVNISSGLEVLIRIIDEDLEKIEQSTFSKVKSFLTSDDTIKISKYFKIENSNNYQVAQEKSDFSIEPNPVIGLFTIIIFCSIYLYFINDFSVWHVILGMVSIIFSAYQATKYIGSFLGTISMRTLTDENAFICKIIKTRKFNLIKPSLYYEIIEKVIDNRGKEISTNTRILFTSEKKRLNNFKSSPEIKFLYPKQHGLHSYKYGRASLFWQMNLEGKYLGLRLKYKSTFKILRK